MKDTTDYASQDAIDKCNSVGRQENLAQSKSLFCRDAYDGDENLRLALVNLVQIIGEAARRVSAETWAVYPEIPWREIIGIRHRIVHDYMSVDEDILWVVVTKYLPSLIGSLEEVIPNEEIAGEDKERAP